MERKTGDKKFTAEERKLYVSFREEFKLKYDLNDKEWWMHERNRIAHAYFEEVDAPPGTGASRLRSILIQQEIAKRRLVSQQFASAGRFLDLLLPAGPKSEAEIGDLEEAFQKRAAKDLKHARWWLRAQVALKVYHRALQLLADFVSARRGNFGDKPHPSGKPPRGRKSGGADRPPPPIDGPFFH